MDTHLLYYYVNIRRNKEEFTVISHTKKLNFLREGDRCQMSGVKLQDLEVSLVIPEFLRTLK